MITALILMHLFGGGIPDLFLRPHFKIVESTVEDSSRAAAVTRAMERINENLADLAEGRNKFFEDLIEVNKNVDAPEDAYEEILDELSRVRVEARQKYIQDVFIMRRNMTRQEWDTAFVNAKQ
jgi:hypothetical protein